MLIQRAMNGDKKTVLCSSQRSGMFGYDKLLRFKIFCTGTNKANGRKESQNEGRRFVAFRTLRCRCFYFRFPVAYVRRSHGRPVLQQCLKWSIFSFLLISFSFATGGRPFTSHVLRCARLITYVLIEIDWVKMARNILFMYICIYLFRRYQRLCGLRHWSTAAGLLGLWICILPGSWMSFYCYCYVLSGRGLWDGLITRSEES
jgi:hypothetical protein